MMTTLPLSFINSLLGSCPLFYMMEQGDDDSEDSSSSHGSDSKKVMTCLTFKGLTPQSTIKPHYYLGDTPTNFLHYVQQELGWAEAKEEHLIKSEIPDLAAEKVRRTVEALIVKKEGGRRKRRCIGEN